MINWRYTPATETAVESWTWYLCTLPLCREWIVIWKPPHLSGEFQYCHTNEMICKTSGKPLELATLKASDVDQAKHMAEVKYYGGLAA